MESKLGGELQLRPPLKSFFRVLISTLISRDQDKQYGPFSWQVQGHGWQ